jgi:hypothetical protein
VVVEALRARILELERGSAVAAEVSSAAQSSEVREHSDLPARIDTVSVTMQARAAHGLSDAFSSCRNSIRGYVTTLLRLARLARR